jgi:uncharacterized protein
MLTHVHKPELHLFRHQQRWYCLDVARTRFGPLTPLEREILAIPEGTPIPQVVNRLADGHGQEAVQGALTELERRRLLLDGPQVKGTPWSPPPRRITRLVMNVAEECNLACRYCIVGQGRFRGRGGLMSREVALRGVDFLLEASGDSLHCKIEFFGGEPLLNFEVIRETVAYGQVAARRRGKQITFGIVTNGTLLNGERIAFLKHSRVHVGVSLDGPPEVHDRMRRFSDGRGSYQATVSHLPLLLADYTDKVHVRTTLTEQQTGAVRTLDHLIGLGFQDIHIGYRGGQGDGDFQSAEARRRLKAAYIRLAHRFLANAIERDFSARYPFLPYLLHFCSNQPRRAYCDAGRRMLGLSADGGLYPCSIFAQLPKYRMGDVWAGLDKSRLEWLPEINIENDAVCKKCWARCICGGGCLYLIAEGDGAPRFTQSAECEVIRHIIQLAMWVHSELRERSPTAFVDLLSAVDKQRVPAL